MTSGGFGLFHKNAVANLWLVDQWMTLRPLRRTTESLAGVLVTPVYKKHHCNVNFVRGKLCVNRNSVLDSWNLTEVRQNTWQKRLWQEAQLDRHRHSWIFILGVLLNGLVRSKGETRTFVLFLVSSGNQQEHWSERWTFSSVSRWSWACRWRLQNRTSTTPNRLLFRRKNFWHTKLETCCRTMANLLFHWLDFLETACRFLCLCSRVTGESPVIFTWQDWHWMTI